MLKIYMVICGMQSVCVVGVGWEGRFLCQEAFSEGLFNM